MNGLSKIKIEQHGNTGKIIIDGKELERVTGFTLTWDNNKRITILKVNQTFLSRDVKIESEVNV